MSVIKIGERGMRELLIRDCSLRDGRRVHVRIAGGIVREVADALPSGDGSAIDAAGGLLLPGLHDHHLHVAATASTAASVRCGPPEVMDEADLREALAAATGTGWLRGIGYHDSVAGMIDCHWLDRALPDRPVRIQHRSGRQWTFNTLALETLLAASPDAAERLEKESGHYTGRLADQDAWLRAALRGGAPAFDGVGGDLARFGVTGITDMTVSNDVAMAQHFASEHARGALPQRITLAGSASLGQPLPPGITRGPFKLHLHEADLPDYAETVRAIAQAHAAGRAVAVHCVTQVELVFTLAAIREAGPFSGDRIEHASLASPELVDQIATLGLAVVTQPNFIAERGDAYRNDIPAAEWPDLYRLRTWRTRGVTLAGGTDAPFGGLDPWRAMAAAVSRRTAQGRVIGASEALTPEEALDLFLADPDDLAKLRQVASGMPADLCLLNAPWEAARGTLSSDLVRATLIGGAIVHNRVDQTDR